MPQKMVPHSVRLSEEDSDFIAKYKTSGAVTPSDKIRAIIREKREQLERRHSYEGLLMSFEDMLLPVVHKLKEEELRADQHSELLALFLDWLVEAASFVAFSAEEEGVAMEKLERGVMERLSRVMEATLRLGVTKSAPCYDPNVIREHLGNILELSMLIQKTNNKGE